MLVVPLDLSLPRDDRDMLTHSLLGWPYTAPQACETCGSDAKLLFGSRVRAYYECCDTTCGSKGMVYRD